ncbi:MAG: hypothetical protein MR971_02640 [Bacteroidales bacterium]|nr:hypothetical protein [Bacteroidales bacterium]
MKKTYIAPQTINYNLRTEGFLCASVFGDNAAVDQSLTTGNEIYNGEFQSNSKGWSSDEWSE